MMPYDTAWAILSRYSPPPAEEPGIRLRNITINTYDRNMTWIINVDQFSIEGSIIHDPAIAFAY